MHIMFVASEATPFSKTGGLADVCSALPKALAKMGRKVSLVVPYYRQTREYFEKLGRLPEQMYGVTLCVTVGKDEKRSAVRYFRSNDVDVYFIEHEEYFDRDGGLYNKSGVDYGDNCERYSFFCHAVLELIERLKLDVDVLHVNDWQTALVPVYLDAFYKSRSKFDSVSGGYGTVVRPELDAIDRTRFDRIKSVITVHNLRHQGRFWSGAMNVVGLPSDRFFTFDKMEFYGQVNLLKSGLIFSDKITTVSPRYAQEIQTEPFGEKLQGVLQCRSNDVVGILNGIDVDEWNPATDQFIEANYDVDTYEQGKPKCKEALQRQLGLTVDPNAPLFGVVSRFDAQKGLDLIADVASELIDVENVQFAVLGSGEQSLADAFLRLQSRYPNNFAVRTTFSVPLSHQIEAGSDVFLMPSLYEPCGLNQMYSLRYGTLPLVRDVGGLHDSVVNATNENIEQGRANGFTFLWGVPEDMRKAINWALLCYRYRKEEWKKMVRAAMSHDLSWAQSAKRYDELYCNLFN